MKSKLKLKLTDSRVRQLAVEGKEYVAWDNQLFGCGLRVRPTGYKAFILHGLVRDKIHKVTLGKFPVMSEAEARQACVDTLTSLQMGEPTQAERISNAPRFDEFIFGAWHEQKFVLLKPTGQRSTRSYINSRLLPEFGKMYLDEINKPGVAEWFDIYSKTYPGGANRALEVLLSILEFAVVCGHLSENPAKGIRKNPKKILNRFLSSEEITRLSKVLKNAEKESRDYRQGADIVRLILLTGCRHREITLLEWSMIRDGIIKIPDTKTGQREVYLSKKAISILERQPRNGTRWVFPWIKDPKLPRNNIDQYWRDMRERAGIEDVRVHDLRHTFASHAVIKGVTIPMVSKLLGHRKTSMTLRYTHVSDKATEVAAERIGATLQELLRGACQSSRAWHPASKQQAQERENSFLEKTGLRLKGRTGYSRRTGRNMARQGDR